MTPIEDSDEEYHANIRRDLRVNILICILLRRGKYSDEIELTISLFCKLTIKRFAFLTKVTRAGYRNHKSLTSLGEGYSVYMDSASDKRLRPRACFINRFGLKLGTFA